MKKIINGKKYDTDTASKLYTWKNEYEADSPYCIEETLYRKRTGEFFLFGRGGSLSKYASTGSLLDSLSGERIMPMEYRDTMHWAERKLRVEEYEAIFGEIDQDDSKEMVCLSLTKTVIEKSRRGAAEAGMTLSDYIDAKLRL